LRRQTSSIAPRIDRSDFSASTFYIPNADNSDWIFDQPTVSKVYSARVELELDYQFHSDTEPVSS
jgi:hypothetical protein